MKYSASLLHHNFSGYCLIRTILSYSTVDKLKLIKFGREIKRMSKQNPTGVFVGGLIIGSAIGTVLGLLIAPRTGKETRKVIKKSADALPEIAEDLTTSIQLQADRLSESTLENWEGTLDRLRTAIAAGIETSRATTRATQLNSDQDANSSTSDRL